MSSWTGLLDCLPGRSALSPGSLAAWLADLERGRPSFMERGGLGDGLLAKLLGQLADLGLWEATVAAERLQKG